MARFTADDIDNYGVSNSGSSFFALKNDMDVAKVRFMYNNAGDVSGYAVHEIEIDGKRKYVNCIREYNEPKSKCPFCAANNFQKAKLYIPLYDVDEGEVKLWERGKTFFAKLSAICARYSSADKPLVSHTFDIERHGKKGDTATDYAIYETGADNTKLADLPPVPDPLGSIILDKNADEMQYFIDNGSFPNNDGAVNRAKAEDRPVGRRTPSSRGTEQF